MSAQLIQMPKTLDLVCALELSNVIAEIEDCTELNFDFKNSRLVEPSAMLLISSEIIRYRARCPQTQVSCSNFEHMTYAGHMGFFKAFGLNFGKSPGEALGSSRYVPLTIYKSEEILKRAVSKGIEVGDEVENISKKLSTLLCHTDEGDLFDTLSYSIREIMRNVIEHSNSDRFGICAQYWPSKSKAEVAILDRGVGVRRSLSNNPHIDTSTDKMALNYALMPAVSGKAFKGSRIRQKGPWANSGFGLYMTNRICRNGGTFFIASGDTGMLLTKKTEAKRYYSCNLQGTAVRMVLKTNELTSLKEALSIYRKEGYEIQRRYREIVNIDPSSASLMLSEDFDLSIWDRLLKKIKGVSS
jgi:hypothetical protein